MTYQYKNLLVEISDKIATVTFNRPDALNALNTEVFAEVTDMMDKFETDESVGGIIFTGGESKAFIAGADIKELAEKNAVEAAIWSRNMMKVFNRIDKFPKPVIAAINGFCLGGGNEYAMACHIRVASEKARFGQPEVHLGLTPGFMGTVRLPRIVGKAKALELLMTGRMIKADEALSIGLVNHVVPHGEVMNKAVEIMKEILVQGPIAVRFIIDSVNTGLNSTLDEGGNFEAEVFGLCFSTEDGKEGLNAFIEKRDPQFKGR
ncbi:MAG TPA: enoyl-CoA hydratase-related protein [bacterium]|jgi:enoyl-CoA hydratase